MNAWTRRLAGTVAGSLLATTIVTCCAEPGSAVVVGGEARDERVHLLAFLTLERQRREASDDSIEYSRTAECLYHDPMNACPEPDGNRTPHSTCEDGPRLPPLWRRDTDATGYGARWIAVLDWTCPEYQYPPFLADAVRELQIEAAPVHQQPEVGPVLVNKPTIVFTDESEQQFRVTLFGYGVDAIVTPLDYTWDFGDGADLRTTDPGEPYPSFDLTHTYQHLGEATIGLTTRWEARYRVDSDPLGKWRTAYGEGQTTATGPAFDIVERRSHLVTP